MQSHTLMLAEKALTLSTPLVMTIINVTPDSFFGGSRTEQAEQITARVDRAVADGAAILDVGGYSSRPGAADVSPAEELSRLHRAMEVIRKRHPQMPVSIDTFRGSVMAEVVSAYGPCIVNDISAGEADPRIIEVAAEHDLPYIAMHMRGTPQTMQQQISDTNITEQVLAYFAERIDALRAAGVKQIVTDPGFGFAKTTEQNFTLLRTMNALQRFGLPVLAGISRKSMIYKTLNITPDEALCGTTALHWECLRQGASILRVHDTAEAVQLVRLFRATYPL